MKKKCQSVEKSLIFFFFFPQQCMCETNADFSQSPLSDFTSHCFQCLNSVSCNLTQSRKVKSSRAIFTLHAFDSKQQTRSNKSNSHAERELLGSRQSSHTRPLVFQRVAEPSLSPFIPTSLINSLPFLRPYVNSEHEVPNTIQVMKNCFLIRHLKPHTLHIYIK